MTAVAGFLRQYAGARALVVGSRGNHGGAFMASAVVAQYGAPFPVGRTDSDPRAGTAGNGQVPALGRALDGQRAWFTTPVCYLVKRETYSAAEGR